MKKLLFFVFVMVLSFGVAVPSFAYTKWHSDGYKEDIFDSGGYMNYIETTDFIYKNGTAMVKFRILDSLNNGYDSAKFEFNNKTKIAKAYLSGYDESEILTKSIAVKAGRNSIDCTHMEGYKTIETKVTPENINGSLYVSAIDLGYALVPNYVIYLPSMPIGIGVSIEQEQQSINAVSFIKDGVLYIPVSMHLL